LIRKSFVVNDIIKADSKNLSKFVKPNSVALTITSPPYRNAINYSKHVKNLKNNKNIRFRGDVGITTSDYLDEMEKIFSEVLKVTIPGGFCCIVIGDEVDNGTMIPLSSLLISRLVTEETSENGWHLRDMIIWNKVTAGRNGAGNRFGIFVQNPLPTYYRTNIMHEYIIVLQKGLTRRILDKENTKKIPLNRAMKRQVALSIWDLPVDEAVMNESYKSTWDITPVPPRTVEHPAVFPEQIPWRLINLYSKEGDVILDPMNGSGQTTKIASKLGRKYIGIDKRLPYVKLAKKRLNEPFMLSNFMTPVYLPIKWSDEEESGRKADAHLDVSKVPKGYKFIFSEESMLANPVIIVFDKDEKIQDIFHYDDETKMLTFPTTASCAWIIDGQHRIFGFKDHSEYKLWEEDKNNEYKIPVIAFETLPEIEQSRAFVNINYYQKRIDPSLFSDLATMIKDLKYEITWPCLLVSELNKSPTWKNMIKISEFDTNKPISISAFAKIRLLDTLLGFNKKSKESNPYNGILYELAPFDISKPFDDPGNQESFNKQLKILIRFFKAIKSHVDKKIWDNHEKYGLTNRECVNALLLVLRAFLVYDKNMKYLERYISAVDVINFENEKLLKYGRGYPAFSKIANKIIRKMNKSYKTKLKQIRKKPKKKKKR